MRKLLYYIAYGLWFICSLLPLRLLYVISDVLYILIHCIIGYRRKIVRKNLKESFPEQSTEELRKTEKEFYHWFCDYLVETVKMLTISEEEIKKRIVFKGNELVNQCVEEGQSCAVYLGHYCNWEWITSLPLWVSPKAQCGQLYHPLENADFDRLFLKIRQRFGAVCIPMAESLRYILAYRQKNIPTVIGYISDQKPFWWNIHHWCTFLHHDTPVLSGTERIARRQNQAVFYMDVRRVKRGYYEAEFKLIVREPKKMEEFELTNCYFQLLENSIRRAPQYWLWTHDRWRRTREEFNDRFYVENGKVFEYDVPLSQRKQ
jgi:KDO2-lipid IV(A) lauroyltransferase